MQETQENQKLNVICLSNQLWDTVSPTNKHHVMRRVAERGHKVLFVDPPINTGRLFLKQILKGHWDFWRLLRRFKVVNQNLIDLTPLNVVPFGFITSIFHVIFINLVAARHFKKGHKTVLWVYHVQIPNLKNYLKFVKHDFLVYDCVDEYTQFPKEHPLYGTNTSDVVGQEELVAKSAGVVFATTPALVEKLQKYNQNVHWTPNVGSYEKFKNAKKNKYSLPEDLEQIPRPRIGFTGSVDDYKFDRDLLKKVAADHPNYQFVIIGPLAITETEVTNESLGFGGFENVHFMGSRPFDSIERYFAGFDVYIIPYVLNDYTVGGCFPVKFHDALAAGLPTVVTALPSYEPFKQVSYISRNLEEFSKNIEKALNEDSPQKMQARQEIARQNSWENKVTKLLGLVNKYIEEYK